MSQKEDRLMSIGEIAKSLGITRRIILNYEEKEKTYACKIGDGSVRTAKGYDVWCADPDHYRSERPDRGKL